MSGFPLRIAPITAITVRQLRGGSLIKVALALSLLPVVFALINMLRRDASAPVFFVSTLYRELVLPTLAPIIILLIATAAFGNDLEDRTLPFITMKPVARWRIVLEKWLAVLIVVLPTLLIGLVALIGVASLDDASTPAAAPSLLKALGAMFAGVTIEALLISSAFLLVSLLIQRALLAGMIYVFVWESLLGRFLPGLKAVSARYAGESVFVRLLDSQFVAKPDAAALSSVLIVTAAVVIGSLVLATLRLRSINLE